MENSHNTNNTNETKGNHIFWNTITFLDKFVMITFYAMAVNRHCLSKITLPNNVQFLVVLDKNQMTYITCSTFWSKAY